MTKLNEYVQTAAAAEILGVSENTLRKWAEIGIIQMRRNPANGCRLFRKDDLQKYLKRIAASRTGNSAFKRKAIRQR